MGPSDAALAAAFREFKDAHHPSSAAGALFRAIEARACKIDTESIPADERKPDGYAYRYPDAWGSGRTVIEFSGGQTRNGNRPLEAIPYYFGAPARELDAAKGGLTEAQKVERDACLYGTGFMRDGKHIPAQEVMVMTTPPTQPGDAVEAVAWKSVRQEMVDVSCRGGLTMERLNDWLNRLTPPRAAIAAMPASGEGVDAARYRWLRNKAENATTGPFIAYRNAFGVSAWTGELADAKIDAARGEG